LTPAFRAEKVAHVSSSNWNSIFNFVRFIANVLGR
jgi:hypothetical protein